MEGLSPNIDGQNSVISTPLAATDVSAVKPRSSIARQTRTKQSLVNVPMDVFDAILTPVNVPMDVFDAILQTIMLRTPPLANHVNLITMTVSQSRRRKCESDAEEGDDDEDDDDEDDDEADDDDGDEDYDDDPEPEESDDDGPFADDRDEESEVEDARPNQQLPFLSQ
ncbi:hypothetical protein V7S43_012125 [Phytophthora oleae]|uniref:Uncharacterized protein n=1 Tax=Phytophthora oleae TaxID=2107226 RepID=A0ABD3F8C4_9STRA